MILTLARLWIRASVPIGVARSVLARMLGLGWLRPGRVGLAVPIALGLVVVASASQLGETVVAGVPFWVAWPVVAIAIYVLGVVAAGLPSAAAGQDGRGSRRNPASDRLGFLLVAAVLALWLVYDAAYLQRSHLYDLNVYLDSASRWLDGGRPYMPSVQPSWPSSASKDFFLYSPPLLPFFALLSRLPGPAVELGWTLAMVWCGYRAFRVLGLSRGMSLAWLAFPPVMIGFESGNVASLTFLLFVLAVRAGGNLIVDGLFKTQSVVPALWLLRERRWRGLLAGVAIVALIVVATLPLVGVAAWQAWWASLGYRAATQVNAPSLYGYSVASWLPGAAFVLLGLALVVLALLFRGRRGLAALGLASIFVSPSLWPHGFGFALPAVLTLESGVAVWAVLGAGALGGNMWLLFWAGWLAVVAARRLPRGSIHPLAGTDGPWPATMALTATFGHNGGSQDRSPRASTRLRNGFEREQWDPEQEPGR